MEENQNETDRVIEIPESNEPIRSESMVIGAPKEETSQGGWRKTFWAGLVVVVVLGLATNQWQSTPEGEGQSAQVSETSGFWSNLFGGKEEEEKIEAPSEKGIDLSFVKDADYVSPLDRTALYSVRDGQYKTERLEFVPNQSLVAKGDLNGDGKEDAAVIANEKSGRHDFSLLSIFENTETGYKNEHTLILGDAINVISLKIESGIIRVGIVTHGPEDLISEPTHLRTLIVKYDAQKGWLMEYAN